jgi:hypothetical protein
MWKNMNQKPPLIFAGFWRLQTPETEFMENCAERLGLAGKVLN